jgi:hypothetical protein
MGPAVDQDRGQAAVSVAPQVPAGVLPGVALEDRVPPVVAAAVPVVQAAQDLVC